MTEMTRLDSNSIEENSEQINEPRWPRYDETRIQSKKIPQSIQITRIKLLLRRIREQQMNTDMTRRSLHATATTTTFHAHAHGTPHRTPRFVAEGEESESWAYFATHQYVRIDRVVPEFLLRAGPAHDLFSPTKSAMMAPWRIPLPPQPLSSRRRRERIIK